MRLPDTHEICDAERVENRIPDAGQDDPEEDEGETEPVDPATSGIVAGLLQRVRVVRGPAHSGGKTGQVGSRVQDSQASARFIFALVRYPVAIPI